MRVFITGATGLIGSAVLTELVSAGHQVSGLARSEASAKKLASVGAEPIQGSIEDLEVLKRASAKADGVVHTAFYHQLSHMPLGTRLKVLLDGFPSKIFERFMQAGVSADANAINAIGGALAKGQRFVATFGTMGMRFGQLATEDEPYNHDPSALGFKRARSEDTLHNFASRGVRTSIIRLPPVVHGPRAFGLASLLISPARKKRQSAYIGNGMNKWPAVHHMDAARLFRLALENGAEGGVYHGVDEEGVPFRQIAETIGKRLSVPVVSKRLDQAKVFGMASRFAAIDNPASSKWTRERLGWKPIHQGFLAALEGSDVFTR